MENQTSQKQLLFLEPSLRPGETKGEFVKRLIAAMERAGIKVDRREEKMKENSDS